MRFSQKRGRPKSNRPQHDLGTPELIFKRACELTDEPLDICHRRQLISDAEHWSGLHYRWLYTLRYGTVDPTSIRWDIAEFGGSTAQNDPDWREAREQELHEASEHLRSHALYRPVLELCVFNRRPKFLSRAQCIRAFENQSIHLSAELEELQTGLALLASLWRRNKTLKKR